MQVGMSVLDTASELMKNRTAAAVEGAGNGAEESGRQSVKSVVSLGWDEQVVSFDDIAQAAAQIDQALAKHDVRLEFSVHNIVNEIMVKVVDAETGEVIREIPPEKLLDLKAMAYIELGLLVDERV
ncbi:MAG TPA: flagellar protein FlaG [Syntrophomonas sp.]|nr:flagellar protein FlaG [Syntrophomonas sp.]